MTSEKKSEESRRYRASLFWTANLVLAPTLGITGFSIGMILSALKGDSGGWQLTIFMSICAVLGLLAYFPGNLNVLWPYAVVLEPEIGLTLFGPLKKLRIPLADIGEIEDSLFWQGYVIHLTKPRAALTQFIIPWYFGSQREELLRAIRSSVEQGTA